MLLSNNLASQSSSTRYGRSYKWWNVQYLYIVASNLVCQVVILIIFWHFFGLRCKQSFSVDRQDFEGTDTISCPLRRCDHIWCKQCQQTIVLGIKHSCDGLLELDRLAKKSGWKYCPSKSCYFFCLAIVLLTFLSGCKTLIEKVDGCNHMTVSVN